MSSVAFVAISVLSFNDVSVHNLLAGNIIVSKRISSDWSYKFCFILNNFESFLLHKLCLLEKKIIGKYIGSMIEEKNFDFQDRIILIAVVSALGCAAFSATLSVEVLFSSDAFLSLD